MNKNCPDCGAAYPAAGGTNHAYLGASAECWTAFNEVLAREFQDATYFAVHRLTVDAYTVQHPGDQSDRRAAQSVNIHLTALYLVLEQNAEFSFAANALGILAKRFKNAFEPLEPPAPDAYEIRVPDILKATDAVGHGEIVRAWAEDVWRAWSAHHHVAHKWAQVVTKAA